MEEMNKYYYYYWIGIKLKFLLFLLLFIFISISISAFLTLPLLVSRCGNLTAKAHDSHLYFQENGKALGNFKTNNGKEMTWSRTSTSTSTAAVSRNRRILSGLGSSPPHCAWKCDRCTPCKPVHVPVPPGTPVTAEYYPEAWRCKCGNKLYMP